MKKDLVNITEEEVRMICEFYGEPFISYMTNSHCRWTDIGMAVCITTTLSTDHSPSMRGFDSTIAIFYDGRINLNRHSGWSHISEDINPLITIDYLRKRGYEFKYELPKKINRKIKLQQINNIEK